MPILPTGDIDLYYETAGHGPKLLFISGTGGDLRNRPNIFDGPLSAHFELTSFDQRGLGQSGKPDRRYSMADYADDAARLMDGLHWDESHIFGYSFGGMVAQELALRHPDRVSRLVLAATSPGGAGGSSFPFHTLTLTGEERARHMIPISDQRHDQAWAQSHSDQYEQMVKLAAHDPLSNEPERQMGAKRQLEARQGHDTWDRLPGIAIPVLVAGGRYDGIAPLTVQHNLARQIPNAQLELFEGGHMFLVQDPKAFPAIINFLKGSA
jgi:3-oxoadipate enol-lactonase